VAVDSLKGVYVLIIELSQGAEVQVGALGIVHFAKGLYAYVGSAQDGLEKRIERHIRKEKRVFWHVDYLLENPDTRIRAVFVKEAPKTTECTIAVVIGQNGEAVAGFGCSDCRCLSHLHRIEGYDFLFGFMRELDMPNPSTISLTAPVSVC
jgi:Uri superfamily endonuclease